MAHTDSEQKEEKLYKFLYKALDDYDNGERKHLNMLQDEVCQKSKDKELLKMWMNCFMKKVFQNKEKKDAKIHEQQSKYLIELILYKMPFFDIEKGVNNHAEILNVLEKFILQLVSQKQNAYFAAVLQHLIDNLVPLQYNDLYSGKMNEQSVNICGKEFEGKIEIIQYIKKILNSYGCQTLSDCISLSEEDQNFMLEIFKYHPNKIQKLANMENISVGQQIFGGNTQRLFIIQKANGEKEEISYVKSVANYLEQSYIKNKINYGQEKFRRVNEFIIQLLCKLLKIYPLQQKYFLQIVQEKYPHKIQNEECHKIYLISLLKIIQKHPALFNNIFKIIIQKLIEIDAEIKLETNQVTSDNQLSSEEKQNIVDQMARKLDWLMLIIFEFIDIQFTKVDKKKDESDSEEEEVETVQQKNIKRKKSIQNLGKKKFSVEQISTNKDSGVFSNVNVKKFTRQQQKKFFDNLLDIFQKEILITHECKFVQFLMFKLCQLDKEHCEQFMSILIKNILIKTDQLYLQTKINSTFYLMSFIARALFVDGETIWKTIDFIMTYIKDYMENNPERQNEELERGQMIKEHQILYYNLQMIFYIILYRHKHLEKSKLDKVFAFLEQNLGQTFKALNFIQHHVLLQFQYLLRNEYTGQYDNLLKIFVDHQEVNNNYVLQKYSCNEKEKMQLYIYYPFDPYLLQYSEKYIDQYLEWDQTHNNNNNNNNINISPNTCSTTDPQDNQSIEEDRIDSEESESISQTKKISQKLKKYSKDSFQQLQQQQNQKENKKSKKNKKQNLSQLEKSTTINKKRKMI